LKPVGRRSQIPDPVLIFTLGLQASAVWLGLRIAKAAADAIEPELKDFFDVMIAATKRIARSVVPKTRPVTYVLQVHGTPNLEFIARTHDPDKAIKAFTGADFADPMERASELAKSLGAEFVQYVLDDDGEWRFHFLLTPTGQVIGTRCAFDHRAKLLTAMGHDSNLPKARKRRRKKANKEGKK
jgi:hypothetical protein